MGLRASIGQRLCHARYAIEDWTKPFCAPTDLCIAHTFRRPPWGGGNQFCLALSSEFERRGLRVHRGLRPVSAGVCLINSFNFDFERLRKLAPSFGRLVHRVDGPVGLYRGEGDTLDRRIAQINADLADATVFQSHYSLRAHEDLGLQFQNACVIPNAVDGAIFYAGDRAPFDPDRKLRLITTAWSPNPNKGGPILKQIEARLDWDRFEWTFVGNTSERFDRIRTVAPMPSQRLARVLREHDAYVAVSRHEPCSNAVLEAMACGLPVVHLNSGSHAELVKRAGLGFATPDEAVASLEQMRLERDKFAGRIEILNIEQVGDRYAAVLFNESASRHDHQATKHNT